jgi:hypothetical protein
MWHTIIEDLSLDGRKFYCKVTQKVNKFCAGHYNGYITEKGNVIAAFQSTGGTVPTLRLEQASEIFTRQITSYLEQEALEKL